MVVKRNKAINEQRQHLTSLRDDMQKRLEAIRSSMADIDKVEEFIGLVMNNLKEFSFEEKRLALQALGIKVWLNGQDIEVAGSIPVGAVATNQPCFIGIDNISKQD